MAPAVTEEYLQVGGITTSVLKCGDTSSTDVLALIIPGNPGVALYYEEFMSALNAESQGRLPVWCVSHAGHGYVPDYTNTNADADSLGLQGQIRHKLAFVRDHVPPDTRLVLVGHSIGCYMILHMLGAVGARVAECALLFPTVERMAQSPQGRWAAPLLAYLRWLAPLPMYPAALLLPDSLKDALLRWYFRGRAVPAAAVTATKRLADAFSVRNVTHMAHQEMAGVVGADHGLIADYLGRLVWYYGARDHWCPVEYCEDMRARHPAARLVLCPHNYAHAFVLEHSRGMAAWLWAWLDTHAKLGL